MGHFPWDQDPMNETKQTKQMILLLKFASNTDLGPKKIDCMISN